MANDGDKQNSLILEGTVCQICGIYLGTGDGFPVTCHTCGGDWEENSDDKQNEEEDDAQE